MKKVLAFIFAMVMIITPMTVAADNWKLNMYDLEENLDIEKSKSANMCSMNSDNGEKEHVYFENTGSIIIGEKNTVEFTVQTNQTVISVNCEGIGLSINSYDYKNNTVYVEFGSETIRPNFQLIVSVLLESNTILTANMYGCRYENKLFVSGVSKDDAFEKCCLYLAHNGIINYENYKETRNAYYKQSVTISTSSESLNNAAISQTQAETRASSKTTYLKGLLAWNDDRGVEQRCQYLKVNVYDKEVGDPQLLATTYTNSEGFYSVEFENNSSIFELGGYDIYIEVLAAGENVSVKNVSGTTYCISTVDEVINNVKNGSTNTISIKFEMSSNGNYIGGDLAKAVQVSQPAIIASNYAGTMLERTMPNVGIYYPVDDEGCWYSRDKQMIYITGHDYDVAGAPKSYASWDVIMHEYGHFVQHMVGNISNSPGGTHYLYTNMADHYYEEIKNGKLCDSCIKKGTDLQTIDNCRYHAMKLSWGEAWATVFGFMAQQYYIDAIQGIEFAGDVCYNAYNFALSETEDLETHIDEHPGESNETSIISLLYNLYDSNPNDFDNISLGHSGFWNITLLSESEILYDFIEYIMDNNIVNQDDLALLLYYYKINSNVYKIENCSTTSLPTFYWLPRGGSKYYTNDSFQLVFYNINGNEIYRTARIAEKTYIPTQSEWNYILSNCGNKFMWGIISYQTDNIETGPYYSKKSTVVTVSTES